MCHAHKSVSARAGDCSPSKMSRKEEKYTIEIKDINLFCEIIIVGFVPVYPYRKCLFNHRCGFFERPNIITDIMCNT